jgi:hypothetical protein
VLRAVTAAGGYLLVVSLLGLGVGAIVRHTAGAITIVFALVFLAPVLADAVSSGSTVVSKWNLWAAANTLVATLPLPADQPSLALSGLVCTLYVVVPLGLATVLITRRDA